MCWVIVGSDVNSTVMHHFCPFGETPVTPAIQGRRFELFQSASHERRSRMGCGVTRGFVFGVTFGPNASKKIVSNMESKCLSCLSKSQVKF